MLTKLKRLLPPSWRGAVLIVAAVAAVTSVAPVVPATRVAASVEQDCPPDPADSGGVTWAVDAVHPVFYGAQNLTVAANGTPDNMMVYYPSVDGTPSSARMLKLCDTRWPVVLFLHGQPPMGVSNNDYYRRWTLQASELARSGYVVVVPHWAGVLTTDNSTPYVAEVMNDVAWVRQNWSESTWVDQRPEQTAVMGHSFGGLLAARVAVTHPEIRAFVSLGGGFHDPSDGPALLQSIKTPSLLLWAQEQVNEDLDGHTPGDANDVYDQLLQSRYGGPYVGQHFDYLLPGDSGTEERGPCPLIPNVSATLATLFISQRVRVGGSTTDFPVDLSVPAVQLTPEQEVYAGSHLVSLATLKQTPGCQLDLRVDLNMPAVDPVSDFGKPLGTPLQLQLWAHGGAQPYQWSATGLPPGVTLDPATGILSGTTTQPGAFHISYTVTDSYGRTATTGGFTCYVNIPGPTGPRIAGARTGLGWLTLFGTDPYDHVAQYQPQIPGWYRFDGSLRGVAAETNADGRMELFGVGYDGSIWHRAQNAADRNGAIGAWGPWTQLDGTLLSIAAARNADGRIELFGNNALGQVWHRSQTGANTSGSWTPWTLFDGPGMVTVAAETNLDGRIELVGLDGVGHVFQRAQLVAGGGTGWTAWTQLDGTLSTIALARDNDRLEIYGTNSGAAIYHRTQVSPGSTDWTSWEPMDGVLSQVGAQSSDDGRIELVGVQGNGDVWYRYQSSPGSWAGTSWAYLGNMTPATVAVLNLHGLTQTEAITALTNNGLVVGTIGTTAVSESLDNGKVVVQNPAAGTMVSAGTVVNLYIGVWNGSRK